MRKILSVIIITSALFFSCKKTNSNSGGAGGATTETLQSPYYFKCDADGVTKIFAASVYCALTDTIINIASQSVHFSEFQLYGAENSTSPAFIQLTVTGDSSFGKTPATYNVNSIPPVCVYLPNAGDPNGQKFLGGGSFGSIFQMTITAVDQNSITGTFSGAVSGGYPNTTSPTVKQITNGSFYVPLKRL